MDGEESNSGPHLAPLKLRSRLDERALFGPGVLAYVGIHAFFSYQWGNGWGVWDIAFFSFLAVVGGVATVFGLVPIELTADDVGIRYRGLAYDRTFHWSEIESIGVGHNRNFDGWDQPAVRFLTRGGPPKMPPTIGINLKLGDRNAATVASRRGASGYEIGLQSVFGRGVRGIVSDLQARLEQARARADAN